MDNHQAIFNLYPNVKIIRGEIAYDENEQIVQYDAIVVANEVTALQAAETAAEQAQATAKASALAKLTALGLTQNEVKALLGA